MSNFVLRLLEDRLEAGARLAAPLPARNRAIYVINGAVEVTGNSQPVLLGPNEAWFGAESAMVTAGDEAAHLLRWELVKTPFQDNSLALGEGVHSLGKLGALMALDPQHSYLIRCDRVDFPLGGVAYLHTHQGGGIRCLTRGEIRIDTGGLSLFYSTLGAWFEKGPEPVFAAASDQELTSFIRVMILPAALKGKSSLSYINPEDKDKRKTQQYQVFVDELIEL